MVNPRLPLVGVRPDDLLVTSHFKQLRLPRRGMVGSDHGVSIRQSLSTAGIVKWLRRKVLV